MEMDFKIKIALEELKDLNSSAALRAIQIENYIKKLILQIESLEEANEY